MTATNDIILTSDSRLDVAGRGVAFFDTTEYSWGGDIVLTSNAGNVTQQAGAVIDISAAYNNAGTLTVQALGAGAGNVNLAGDIDGASTGQYLAGGGATSDVPLVFMPYAMGGIDISAQTIGDFAGLNQRLTTTGVTGSRSFDIKQGDLIVGNEVKANSVTISVDGGSLTVNGTIDASGAEVGTIRLSARDDLVLTASGKLDAHGTVLQVDSYGDPIESANRAVIELTTTQGTLWLGDGSGSGISGIDVRVTDPRNVDANGVPVAYGEINLNVPRGTSDTAPGALSNVQSLPTDMTSGDIRINAVGPMNITGATSVAVNGFWTYTDAPLASGPDVTGNTPQVITQAYLDAIDVDSNNFINTAAANIAANTIAINFLGTRLSGLTSYTSAFHLRPGVEIVGKPFTTIDSNGNPVINNPNGDLTVQGDLDLSTYRYGPNAIRDPLATGYGTGSGEPGVLLIRAQGNLNIYGSISDGFDKPVATPGDDGWVLIPPEFCDRVHPVRGCGAVFDGCAGSDFRHAGGGDHF